MNRSELVRLSVVSLVSLLIIACLVVSRQIVIRSLKHRSVVARTEDALAARSFQLTPLDTRLPPGVSVFQYRIAQPGNGSGFYLRNVTNDEALLFQDLDAEPRSRSGTLMVYRDAFLQADSQAVIRTFRQIDGWEAFELLPPNTRGSARRSAVHEPEVADGFMRKDIFAGGKWREVSGYWRLNQHGGGMPATEGEAVSPKFQRAVNPFSVLGRTQEGESAVLEYRFPGAPPQEYRVEARFYMPDEISSESGDGGMATTGFLLAHGEPDGEQIGFGWWSDSSPTNGSWFLGRRRGLQPWQRIQAWPALAPPRDNWVRVSLSVAHGHAVEASVDGTVLGTYSHDRLLAGGFQIHSDRFGNECQFDDVAVTALHAVPDHVGSPVFVKSRNFSEKRTFDQQRDPLQFDLWARGRDAYRVCKEADKALDTTSPRICTRLPLYGDFTYRSNPDMPDGKYRFLILSTPAPESPLDVVAGATYMKHGNSWLTLGKDAAANPEFTLEFGREDSRIFRTRQQQRYYLDKPYAGPAYLMIVPPHSDALEPECHNLYSASIRHDMFEKAPSDWYWHDGNFGMNVRWACQPGWNFMGGKSPYLAAMHSKVAYYGDQVLNAYLSLTATLPDNMQFYIRRDFCISFCYDGRNLDSGYTLLFGTDLNRRTLLLKKGKIIASTTEPEFLFPTREHHHAVHWLWWNFTFEKSNRRLRVKLNDRQIFDVADPDPIDGGHVAFWTVNNGFTVARVTVSSQKSVQEPENGRRPPSIATSSWKPVRTETVILESAGERTRVVNASSGGPLAVRIYSHVDLNETPILQLPMEISDDTMINMHLEIDRKPYIVKINAPLTWMPFSLAPGPRIHGGFTRTMLSRDEVDAMLLGEAKPVDGLLCVNLGALLKQKGVTSLPSGVIVVTIGNNSNSGYLMAGFGGNHAGAGYTIGQPVWQKAGHP